MIVDPIDHPAAAPVSAVAKREMSVRQLLEWAFQRELASLDFSRTGRFGGRPLPSFGMEYLMIEQARLGCRVDGGGHSDPHPDADLVADALVALPDRLGGQGMAIRMAELARAGQVPDWMPDPCPSCQPVEWKRHKRGWFAHREYWTRSGRWPSNRLGRDDGYACPIVYTDTACEVAAARRAYLSWWNTLRELRQHFQLFGGLSSIEVTAAMPPMTPWREKNA